jgi:hypothetical protein
MEIEHRELTEQIIAAAFEVHSVLGYGFLEKAYQRAMQVNPIVLSRSAFHPYSIRGQDCPDRMHDSTLCEVLVTVRSAAETDPESGPLKACWRFTIDHGVAMPCGLLDLMAKQRRRTPHSTAPPVANWCT